MVTAALLGGGAVGGLVFARLRQPPLVGYIVAGLALGPSGLALTTHEDREAIERLAELGVLVLLLGLGMHLSLRAFRAIYQLAIAAVTLQVMACCGVTLVLGWWLGWPPSLSVLFGFILSLSSTAVGVKILEDIDELRTDVGRCVIGVLIAQDLAVAPMLIVIQGMAASDGGFNWLLPIKLIAALSIMSAIVWYLSRRQRLHLPFAARIERYPELAPVVALAVCVLASAITGAFDLSAGLGAFLAGLVIGNTAERQIMINGIEPVQSVLMMVFFLSIGLLIDLDYVLANGAIVLTLVTLVFLFNSLVNVAILHGIGVPWRTSLLSGFALAQIGEFSFLLSATAAALGLLDSDAAKLIVAVIAISLVISPLWLDLAHRLHVMREREDDALGDLLARLVNAEARVLRLRSARVAQVAQSLSEEGRQQLGRIFSGDKGQPRDQARDVDALALAGKPADGTPPAARKVKRRRQKRGGHGALRRRR